MKSFLIIGTGKFGHHLCRELAKFDNEIVIADIDENRMDDLLDCVVSAKIGDCRREDVMQTFGVENFDACYVCINDFEASLQITDILNEQGAKYIVALASTNIHEKFLKKNGADMIVYPSRDIAERIAVSHSNDKIFDFIELGEDLAIVEIIPPEAWIGKSIAELNIRGNYELNIIAIKRKTKYILPNPNYRFSNDEHFLAMGKRSDIDKVTK